MQCSCFLYKELNLLQATCHVNECTPHVKADALPSPDEEPGDDLLDALIELPAADMTSSAWWQSL